MSGFVDLAAVWLCCTGNSTVAEFAAFLCASQSVNQMNNESRGKSKRPGTSLSITKSALLKVNKSLVKIQKNE